MSEEVTKSDDYLNSELAVYHTTASHFRYKDIESNVSVRDEFTRDDYEYFRENEILPSRKKSIIKAARKAYDKIGIIRNIIDLMADFTCQGISITHSQPSIEKFYKAWFNKVKGKERSERFTNLLYREANVIVKRDTGKLKSRQIKDLRKSYAADINYDSPKPLAKEVPLKYTFISPLKVEVVGHELNHFLGGLAYYIKLPTSLITAVKKPKNAIEQELVNKLPQYVKDAVDNKGLLLLDRDKTKVYFYKKDDWDLWATPMIYPIMDDLVRLEKLKLADDAALDGAISHVRIWKLGSLEHSIAPGSAYINKLRDILLHNTGGGSMDLVWGPDITLEETNTDMSQFLGAEKYEPTMLAIYEGLGIPPGLTGKNQSGFNNNAISMKTLIERLNYGRMVLTQFWAEEIRIVQKAMGFSQPARLQFDHMAVTDEAAWMALLVQLADRNIISEEYLREKFGDASIEKARVTREWEEFKQDRPKTSPYHNPNLEGELKKAALQKGYAPSQVGLELEPLKKGEIVNVAPTGGGPQSKTPKGVPGQGRPKNSFDSSPRKQRVPKVSGASEEVMKTMIWAQKAYNQIADTILPSVLKAYGCKNVRSMTDEQFKQFERIKFALLCSLKPMSTIDESTLIATLANNPRISQHVDIVYNSLVKDLKEPTIDMLRNAQVLAYAVIQ